MLAEGLTLLSILALSGRSKARGWNRGYQYEEK
jgi:hypothetical protein